MIFLAHATPVYLPVRLMGVSAMTQQYSVKIIRPVTALRLEWSVCCSAPLVRTARVARPVDPWEHAARRQSSVPSVAEDVRAQHIHCVIGTTWGRAPGAERKASVPQDAPVEALPSKAIVDPGATEKNAECRATEWLRRYAILEEAHGAAPVRARTGHVRWLPATANVVRAPPRGASEPALVAQTPRPRVWRLSRPAAGPPIRPARSWPAAGTPG